MCDIPEHGAAKIYSDKRKEQHFAHMERLFSHSGRAAAAHGLQRGPAADCLWEWCVLVVEQSAGDDAPFNRGKLLNIGASIFLRRGQRRHLAGSTFAAPLPWDGHVPDMFIFHDVDVLPNDDLLPWYIAPSTSPTAITHAAWLCKDVSGFGRPYPWYLGGVTALTATQLQATNGFPNDLWGWGGEDDCLRLRCEAASLSILRPPLDAGGFDEIDQRRRSRRTSSAEGCKAAACSTRHAAVTKASMQRSFNGISSLEQKSAGNAAPGASDSRRGGSGSGGYGSGHAWRELEWSQLGQRALKVTVGLFDAQHDPKIEDAMRDGPTAKHLDAAVANAQRATPRIQCYIAQHPLVERSLWAPCLHPAVPHRMACRWMLKCKKTQAQPATEKRTRIQQLT